MLEKNWVRSPHRVSSIVMLVVDNDGYVIESKKQWDAEYVVADMAQGAWRVKI